MLPVSGGFTVMSPAGGLIGDIKHSSSENGTTLTPAGLCQNSAEYRQLKRSRVSVDSDFWTPLHVSFSASIASNECGLFP